MTSYFSRIGQTLSFVQWSSPLEKPKIQEVFWRVAEFFVVSWNLVQYELLSSSHFAKRYRVFKFEDFGPTQNHAKSEELGIYAETLRHPVSLENLKERAHRQSFQLEKQSLSPSPFKEGKCTGASLYVCAEWLKTKDIFHVAETIKGGVPVEGVFTQHVHELFSKPTYDSRSDLHQTLLDYIKNHIEPPDEEETRPILEATRKFIEERHKDYLTYMRSCCNLEARDYETIREVAEELDDSLDHYKWDRNEIVCEAAGLQISEIIYDNVSPETILNHYKELKEGAYILSWRPWNSSTRVGHTLALLKDDTHTFLFDPNIALGNGDHKENLARDLRLYSKQNLSKIPSGYDLYRVEPTQN